jgi:hypothetical protein
MDKDNGRRAMQRYAQVCMVRQYGHRESSPALAGAASVWLHGYHTAGVSIPTGGPHRTRACIYT